MAPGDGCGARYPTAAGWLPELLVLGATASELQLHRSGTRAKAGGEEDQHRRDAPRPMQEVCTAIVLHQCYCLSDVSQLRTFGRQPWVHAARSGTAGTCPKAFAVATSAAEPRAAGREGAPADGGRLGCCSAAAHRPSSQQTACKCNTKTRWPCESAAYIYYDTPSELGLA